MKQRVAVKESGGHVLQCGTGHGKYIDIIFASWLIIYVEQKFSSCLNFFSNPLCS